MVGPLMTQCRAADLTRYPDADSLAPCRKETDGRCAPGCRRARFLLDRIMASQTDETER